MIKVLIFFCSLWAASLSESEDVCYSQLVYFCKEGGEDHVGTVDKCTACYGGFVDKNNVTLHELQNYTSSHLAASFDYLLLATNFGSYMKDRKGFEKLYRHLSDSTWEDGIDLMKYISKRGGSMDFRGLKDVNHVSSLNEIESMGRAMDIHKQLADESFKIHEKASRREGNKMHYEPEVTSYLESKFLHKHAEIIRSLAGHVTDLKKMITNSEKESLSLFLFDEYLQEHYM